MSKPAALWSLNRQPDFRRSAGVATATYVVTLLGPALIALGANDVPLLTFLGGVLVLVGIVWGAQAVHRVTTNIDVAAEAVYARYHARRAADEA